MFLGLPVNAINVEGIFEIVENKKKVVVRQIMFAKDYAEKTFLQITYPGY